MLHVISMWVVDRRTLSRRTKSTRTSRVSACRSIRRQTLTRLMKSSAPSILMKTYWHVHIPTSLSLQPLCLSLSLSLSLSLLLSLSFSLSVSFFPLPPPHPKKSSQHVAFRVHLGMQAAHRGGSDVCGWRWQGGDEHASSKWLTAFYPAIFLYHIHNSNPPKVSATNRSHHCLAACLP